MSAPVTVIDYGAGNLASITAGLERLGSAPQVSDRPEAIAGSSRLVLPGVGAAAPAMAELRRRGLVDAIREAVDRGAALLGICLGMQLLFDRSREGDAECLGLMRGETVPIEWSERLPHMGWNDVDPVTDHPLAAALPSVCYFAHSYVVDPGERSAVVAETDLDGRRFACVVADGRIAGAQFHPEKSGSGGRAILERWLEWSQDAA